jgi:acetyl-CoA carboxylase biotin carboxyl carrier protein
MKIKSPVTGSVVQICVAVGDKVAIGDEVVMLESMKMEIPVVSDYSGTVAEILVEDKLRVQEDDVLIVLR